MCHKNIPKPPPKRFHDELKNEYKKRFWNTVEFSIWLAVKQLTDLPKMMKTALLLLFVGLAFAELNLNADVKPAEPEKKEVDARRPLPIQRLPQQQQRQAPAPRILPAPTGQKRVPSRIPTRVAKRSAQKQRRTLRRGVRRNLRRGARRNLRRIVRRLRQRRGLFSPQQDPHIRFTKFLLSYKSFLNH